MKWHVILPAIILFTVEAAVAWSAAAPNTYDEALKLHRAGKFKEAIAAYDKVIQSSPRSTKAFVGRGEAYVLLGQPQQAIKDFDQAIKLDPKLAEAYYYRAN